jgi:putative NIF3 family GTP cyclohydrolase 1 type 2
VRLNQNVQHVAVLIDRSPQVVASAVDAEIDLIQRPLIPASGPGQLRYERG